MAPNRDTKTLTNPAPVRTLPPCSHCSAVESQDWIIGQNYTQKGKTPQFSKSRHFHAYTTCMWGAGWVVKGWELLTVRCGNSEPWNEDIQRSRASTQPELTPNHLGTVENKFNASLDSHGYKGCVHCAVYFRTVRNTNRNTHPPLHCWWFHPVVQPDLHHACWTNTTLK